MRLAYVIDSLARSGGAEQALAAMAPLWVAQGVIMRVYVIGGGEDLREVLESSRITVIAAPPGGRRAKLLWLRQELQEYQPNLVHTTLFESDIIGRIAARNIGIPSVTSLVATPYGGDHYGQQGLSRSKVASAHAADILTARPAAAFHAVSGHVAAVMSRRLIIPSRRITVIPRGKDPVLLGGRDPKRQQRVRMRLGWEASAPLLVAAARHEPPKGLDVLLRAMSYVVAAQPSVQLAIAGREGTVSPQLHQLRRHLGLEQVVHLLGSRDDVPDLLAAADIVVVPSRREGISNVAIEAMALGTPLVASDVPAVRETVGGDANALLVPLEERSLADAILVTLARGDTGRALSAKRFFERTYQLSNVSEQMNQFHLSIVASHG